MSHIELLSDAVSTLLTTPQKDGKVSDLAWKGLSLLFPHLDSALEIIDENRITKMCAKPSQRCAWRVQGRDSIYVCDSFYCGCYSFQHSVLARNEGMLCKHQIAVMIAQHTGLYSTEEVSNAQLAEILSAT